MITNKNISQFLISISLVCSFSSCEGDFIEIDNPNQMTDDGFWKTEEDMRKAMLASYGGIYFEGTFSQWYDLVFEMRSDLCYNESSWVDYNNFSKFQYPSTNWECISYCWMHHYQAINMTNKFLAHIDDQGIEIDPALRTRWKGEVSFLRALFYFNMANLYGAVPVITEPMDEVKFPANGTVQDVYDQVLADLSVAKAANLPATVPDNELGRVTNGAVVMLQGKAYMQLHNWSEAANCLKSLIDSGLYKLTAEYSDNFDLDHEFNSESVFELNFTDNGGKGDWSGYGHANSPMTTQTSKYFSPRLIGGHSDAQPNYFYLEEFTDKTPDGKTDPRKNKSILWTLSQNLFGKKFTDLGGQRNTNPQRPLIWRIKYSTGQYRTQEDQWSPINSRIMRYADVLLMYAEALNNLGQTKAAYQYIDQVRQRAGVVTLSEFSPNLSQSDMQKQIEHERIVELGGESVRWFDLQRWGYLDTEEGKQMLLEHDYEFQNFRPGYDKYLPIPQNDIDQNPNIRQNPGF